MALVNGGFLHYMDMKKFLKNHLLLNCWSDFEIISQECCLGDPFQILCSLSDLSQKLLNFDQSMNMALVNGGYFHYTNMNKFLENGLL